VYFPFKLPEFFAVGVSIHHAVVAMIPVVVAVMTHVVVAVMIHVVVELCLSVEALDHAVAFLLVLGLWVLVSVLVVEAQNHVVVAGREQIHDLLGRQVYYHRDCVLEDVHEYHLCDKHEQVMDKVH
jgi:hypothetical protein